MVSVNYDMEADFLYYIDNQDKLVDKYNGKVIALQNGVILGEYESEISAIKALSSQHEVGTYLLQRCASGPDNYTITFHSFDIIP